LLLELLYVHIAKNYSLLFHILRKVTTKDSITNYNKSQKSKDEEKEVFWVE